MIGHGERLKQIIEERYSSAASAALFMRKEGHQITEGMLYSIMRGQWPKPYQIEAICEHFDIEPKCLLFGQCYGSRRHGYLMEALSPQMQAMASDMNEAMLEVMVKHTNKESDNNQATPKPSS